MLSASSVNRSCVSLLLGALAWTINLWSAASLEHAEVFAWVADRDAGCVVALDCELRELETWVVPKPSALLADGEVVFVQTSIGETGAWLRLERGAPPGACVPPGSLEPKRMSVDPALLLAGSPTAAARAGDRILVATPGAVHLFTEHAALERVQGGFSWISAVAFRAHESERASRARSRRVVVSEASWEPWEPSEPR